MDFGFLETELGLDVVNLAVSLTPVPNRDGDAGENEMRCVARNIRSARLVNITKMQSRHSTKNAKKSDWVVRAVGPKARRLATHPRRNDETRSSADDVKQNTEDGSDSRMARFSGDRG